MKTELFEAVNRHTARHALQWQPVSETEEDTRSMNLEDAVLVAGLTALVFTLGVLATVFCTVLMG